MKYYTLLNKSNGRRLVHPKVGTWFGNLEEAKDMLAACFEYLDSQGLKLLKPEFIIIDAETSQLPLPQEEGLIAN